MGLTGATKTSFANIPNNTNPKWWLDAGLRRNVLHCAGICLCPFYLGYDQSLLAGLQAIPAWQTYFDKPTGTYLGIIAASIFLPALLVAFIADYLCTAFGRKRIIYVGSVLIVIGGIFNALSQSGGQFMGARVIIGTGGAITKVAAPALLQEIAHPRLRGTIGTLYYSFYYFGSLTAACMSIAGLYIKSEWSWRLPCIVQIIGPVFVMALIVTAPESPRWLAKKGRLDEARAVLVKHHANGDSDDALVEWQFGEILSALHSESLVGKSSYLDFFKTPGNRKRLWINCLLGLASNWVGNGIITYYLAPVLRTLMTAAWNWMVSFGAGTKSERLGRRFLWLASNFGMAVSFAFVMGLSAAFAQTGSAATGLAVVPFLFVVHFFYDIGYITMNYSYTVEIMSPSMRTKGLALYIFFNNLGNAFNQFVNPIALAALTWKYYAVYIAIDVCLGIVVYLYFPETAKMSIEEISMILDYPLKDGRQRVMEVMEERRLAEASEVARTKGLDEGGKMEVSHVEELKR
ncbi:general substrate transporter [Dioszegia hungarica]|uniref:General substrate transporter n=1 Tax=Dioszegia hungarica TaxID=4972 RepID=A0AA38LXU3_9TREE|nr:general substrate transporter [Dioszegia hungarica]KAI9637786.1 general substrate transporter [Dioszegia hungarica]